MGHHIHLVICAGSGHMDSSTQGCMTSILATESYSLPLQGCFNFEESHMTAVMGMKVMKGKQPKNSVVLKNI